MAPPGIPEEALHKMLQQIQAQVINSNRQLSMVRAQLTATEQARKRCQLTAKQLDEEGDDARVYQGVGKMFILEDKSSVISSLTARDKELAEEISNLLKKQKYLEKQASDAQGHLRDLFAGVQRQQAAQGA